MKLSLLVLVGLGIVCSAVSSGQKTVVPSPIKSNHWQLFLDDYVIARATGFDRVVHHPRPMGVVLAADKPWETVGARMSFVDRRDDGSFYAFYDASWWNLDNITDSGQDLERAIQSHGAYATSKDGVHWKKPILGLIEGPADIDWQRHAPYSSPKDTTQENNLLSAPNIFDLGQFGNVSDPDKRYRVENYFVSELPEFSASFFLDNPNWREKITKTGIKFTLPPRGSFGFWDDIHKEWVGMSQGVSGHWIPSRDIARFSTKDFVNWTAQTVMYPDPADSHFPHQYDEPYSLEAFCTEGVVFGLLNWYHSDRTHPDGGPVWKPTPEHPYRWPWCRKGTLELRITISRDGGLTWDRTSSREAWIPHGTEEDSYNRMVFGGMPPLRVGDEDWFYVIVCNGNHLLWRNNPNQTPYYHNRLPKSQTALYVQKHNRYVSLRAGNQPEVLITKPILVTGDILKLNVDASHGELRVGIAAAETASLYGDSTSAWAPHLLEGHLLPGFSFDDCKPVLTNSIEHTVQFKNGDTLESLKGRSVCLLFQMVDADLYGFRIYSIE